MSSTGPHGLTKIVVLNPKGGCGKTTLATNLASLYAIRGAAPTLLDFDPHGFSMRWLEKRPAERPEIVGIAASDKPVDCAWAIQSESPCRVMIIDLPAASAFHRLDAFTWIADRILIPVMPSEIDVHAATRLIERLLLEAHLDRRARKLAVVASRVRSNTRSFQMLMRFLTSLRIPLVGVIRDTQNYVQAAAQGIGVCELPAYRARHDALQMNAIVEWLDGAPAYDSPLASALEDPAERDSTEVARAEDVDSRAESVVPTAWAEFSHRR
jgi:chromosome partitioning protein